MFLQKAVIGIGFLLSQLICAPVFGDLPDSQPPLASKPEILRVGPASMPPVIDGELDDKCWQDASMTSGFIANNDGLGLWATEQTTAYVTYDDACLYMAFRCNESAPEWIETGAKTNDALSIFSDDSVEIFLDTNHDRTTYYHFGINAIGTRYEASCQSGKGLRNDGWNPDWEVKTKIEAQYWVVELRIPFASLGASYPKPGAVWGINFSRNRQTGVQVQQRYTSWAMISGGFNQPDKFGELMFGDYPDVSYSVISIRDSPTDNELKIRFRNGKESLLALRAQWTVGASSKIAVVRLGPKKEKEVCLGGNKDMSSKPGSVIDLALTVANAKTGEIYDFRKGGWEPTSPLEMSISEKARWEPNPPLEMSLDRYYYTPDVQQVQVGFTRKIKNGDFLKVEIGKNPDEKPVVSRQISLAPGQGDYNASFDITDWDDGRYVVSACLQDKKGKTLSSVARVFIKKKIEPAKIPSPAPKVSLRPDGIILLDGQPFCPFFASTPTSGDKKSPLVKDCFNVGYAGFGDVSRPLTRPGIGLQEPLLEEEKMLEAVRAAVTARKTDPSLLYWFMRYEASRTMYRGKDKKVMVNSADELRKINRFVKSIDPDHPTALEIDSGNWADYKDAADIIEVASWGSSYAKHLVPNLTKDIDEVREALGPGKPFILWIGSSIPSADRRTAEEIRCASYLALMHGAAGICFHMGHAGISQSMTRHWSVYPGLAREVEELFPILAAARPSGRYGIAMDPAWLDYCVREYNNRLYLVVVNTSGGLIKARISFADASVISKRIKVLFENREIELTGNGFVDVFTAFEPHVYEIIPGGKLP